MSAKPIEIRIRQRAAADGEPTYPPYLGPSFFSFGFRPFFLGAALFAGLAVPVWIMIVAGAIDPQFLYPPRDWHVHEMLFGFVPAVMAGFILTAVPHWTGRTPVRGVFLAFLSILWLAGRVAVVLLGPASQAAAVIDAGFLVSLATVLWREIVTTRSWNRSPIGLLVTLYTVANIAFHILAFKGRPTDLPEHAALSVLLLLFVFIGGRVTPAFTGEYLAEQESTARPATFSRIDVIAISSVLMALLAWMVQADGKAAAALLMFAGLANLVRVSGWHGWLAWREPLVVVLTVGYVWVALSFLALGGAVLELLPAENAVHVLTAGAVGTMTLAIMTRASLGHTGRPRHAGVLTVAIYLLVNLGAILRIVTPSFDAPPTVTIAMLAMAALGWSGAYVLFVVVYGRILLGPAIDE